MKSQEYKAGQVAAYFDALNMLERIRKKCSPLSVEEAHLLVAEHRIASAAVEATK